MQRYRQLSFVQEGLYILHEAQPASAAYNVGAAVKVSELLRPEVLASAARMLAGRHEQLRSLFVRTPSGPARVTLDDALPGVTTCADADPLRAVGLETFLAQVCAQPFKLAEEPAWRIVLIPDPPGCLLVLVTHHIISDAASQAVILRDLLEAYGYAEQQAEPRWRPLMATYDDYVAGERAMVASAEGNARLDYWRRVCSGVPWLDLPADRPRPAVQRLAGKAARLEIPGPLAEQLAAAARRMRVTKFVYLLGLWQATLSRYSGQSEFLVGYAATTRMKKEWRDVVGCFVNSVPCRAYFDGATTAGDAVYSAAGQFRAAMAAGSYPYALLPRALSLRPEPGRNALFQQLFSFLAPDPAGPLSSLIGAASGPGSYAEIAGKRAWRIPFPQQEGQFDLAIEVEWGTAARMYWKYRTDLFDHASIMNLAESYIRILGSAAQDPDLLIRAMTLLAG